MAFWAVVVTLLPVAMLVWPLTAMMKMFAARGTRQRWVASSWERAFRYPNIVAQLVLLALNVRASDWLGVGLCAVSLGAAAALIMYFGDDDEDFWTGFMKKVRDGAAQTFASVAPEHARSK